MQNGYAPLDISVAVGTDGWTVVEVSGEIDVASAPLLRSELVRHLYDGRNTAVDMGGVTFIDGAGISALLAARKAAERRGVELRLRRAQGRPVGWLLRLTGADQVLVNE